MRIELLQRGEHMMTVCNACRYCEQYCPVFPAMEERRTFGKADLLYLANLCHNCGECLYACQYAPPHEFGIDLPRQLAELRVASYEEYCWPASLGGAFRQQGLATGTALAAVLSAVMLASAWLFNPGALWRPNPGGDFYSVVPHGVMVGLFGGVSLFVLSALVIGVSRFWRDGAPRTSSIAHRRGPCARASRWVDAQAPAFERRGVHNRRGASALHGAAGFITARSTVSCSVSRRPQSRQCTTLSDGARPTHTPACQ